MPLLSPVPVPKTRFEKRRPQQPTRHWWAGAFALLFAVYQLPQLLARLGVAQPLASLAMLGVYPAAAWLAWRGRLHFSVAYGLHAHARRWLWLPSLFALALAAKAAAVVAGTVVGVYASHGPAAPTPGTGSWLWLMFATFVPSLAEDLVTRGVWWHSPASRNGALFAGATAAVYTLNHVWRLALGPAEWFMLFCFGLAYAAAFWCTGTLWAAVGLHWGWNFAGQAVDAVWSVSVVDETDARLLSAAVHLALGAAAVALARRRMRRHTIRANSDTVAERIDQRTQP